MPMIWRRSRFTKVIPDSSANRNGFVRVVDESAEDYLYPESYFIALELSLEAKRALMA